MRLCDRCFFLTCLAALTGGTLPRARAAALYVDGSATGAQDGTSWRDAWTSLSAIRGVAPGDTVYISGGPGGQSQAYPMTTWAAIAGGSPGARVTYRIGGDAAHNGTAVFRCSGVRRPWIQPVSDAAIIGDGGDGQPHFRLVGWSSVILGNGQANLRLAYLSADDLDLIGDFNPVTGLEIDHCRFRIANLKADHATYAQIQGTTWDDSRFHHNTLYIPNAGNGAGCDGLQWNGTGFSIYANLIVGYVARYAGDQHQDGWQGTGNSSYIKIYDNTFRDIANYPVFGDAYYGGFSHLRITGNLVELADPGIQQSDAPQGIAVGPDGGSFGVMGRWPVFDDIAICSNVIADYGAHLAIALQNNSGQSSTFTACIVADNAIVNSHGIAVDRAIAVAGNISLAPARAARAFRRYRPLSPDNDFHLVAGATSLIGRGPSLSRYFAADRDGALRGPAAKWDVGAYVFTGPERAEKP